MTKLKNWIFLIFFKLQIPIVTKTKLWGNAKLKLWQNSKRDKTKIKLRSWKLNLKKKLNLFTYFCKNNWTPQQPMKCTLGSVLQSYNVCTKPPCCSGCRPYGCISTNRQNPPIYFHMNEQKLVQHCQSKINANAC